MQGSALSAVQAPPPPLPPPLLPDPCYRLLPCVLRATRASPPQSGLASTAPKTSIQLLPCSTGSLFSAGTLSGPEDGGLPRPTPPSPPLPCQVPHQQLSDLIMFGSLSVQGGKGWDQQANERMALQLLCHG